ncbi:ACP S-malonyltransferase [Lactobacillus crispatus]|uniref:ACP S-malonyltransferase n=1 Tax=Lactobacillus crispatus TaxID=47770 RepID=UPI0022E7D76A|nr:ACP S-malonyltransferase [Lactobacillus crispatus]
MEKTMCLFTGQGSQYPGMLQTMITRCGDAKKYFQIAFKVTNMDLANICFGNKTDFLQSTRYSQIAIVVYEYILYKLWSKNNKIHPNYLAGHSLGELVALAVSGTFSFKDLLVIAKKRGELMQKCSDNYDCSMLAVLNMKSSIYKLQKKYSNVYVANYNSTLQTVFSGNKSELLAFSKDIIKENSILILLNVTGAFHSPYMNDIIPEYRDLINSIHFNQPHIPIYSNVTGGIYPQNEDAIKELLIKQVTSPVKWTTIIDNANSNSIDKYIEFGPKKTLLRFLPTTSNIKREFIFEKNIMLM